MIQETKKAKSQKSYNFNTAIKRTKPSLPLRFLIDKNLLKGSILDYGCGRGFDAEYLDKKGFCIDSYDPHWNPSGIKKSVYDTIFCNYVLNVLETDDEIFSVIKNVQDLLKNNGLAYFAVRRDLKKDGFTTRGYQRVVKLKAPTAFKKSGSFCTYVIGKDFFSKPSDLCYR